MKDYKKEIIVAFLQMVRQADLRSIKISDIATHLNISRTTFYNYFNSKKDLQNQSIAYILNEVTNILVKDLNFSKPTIIELLYYLKSNKKLVNLLIAQFKNTESIIKNYIRDMILNSDIPNLHNQLVNSYKVDYKYALDIYVSTIESIIFTWITAGMKDSPEKIANFIYYSVKI